MFGLLAYKMRPVASLLVLSVLLWLGTCDSSSPSSEEESEKIICDVHEEVLDCVKGVLNIGSAVSGWGAVNMSCPSPSRLITTCGIKNVTDNVIQACDGLTRCTLQPSKDLQWFELCPMRVKYSCTALSQNPEWSYTFRFIDFSGGKGFKTHLKITLNSEERTCISVPCLNISQCFQGLGDQTFPMIETTTCATISVSSTADITVHGIVHSGGAITGGFLALPDDCLGTEYLIDVYTPTSEASPQAAISAISDDTNVTIDCVSDCTVDGKTFSRNIILNASDSVLLKTATEGMNLTGTLVRSDKPIAVVVGSLFVDVEVSVKNTPLDHGVIIEQLLPISKWGYIHFVPPFQNATNGWVVRVSAFYHNTTATLEGCGDETLQHLILTRSEYIDIKISERNRPVCMIMSSMPVQVMQYMASSTVNEYGDPSMTLIPPVQNFHGNTTLRIGNYSSIPNIHHYADFITTESGKDSLLLNGTAVTNLTGYCFNTTETEDLPKSRLAHMRVKGFCYFYALLETGVYHVTQSDQSEKFLVRLYPHTKNVGGAMLADVSFQTDEMQNLTSVSSVQIDTTVAATTSEMSDEEKRTSLFAKLQAQGDFQTFGEAEAAMSDFTKYLGDKEELGSVDDLAFAFDYFTGVLQRKPLKNATGQNAQSFLGLSSDAIHVIFANQTNHLLADACASGTELESTPEDAQRELEGLMNDAATLIVDDGTPSFGITKKNAGIAVSSTNLATSSVTTAVPALLCEEPLDLNGVQIPCEVLLELESFATYQINLPYGAEAVARSSCAKYNENKTTVASPLLGVGLISNRSKENFSSNISLTFPTTATEKGIMDNNTICSYWDYSASNWSTLGCTLGVIDVTDNGTMVTCLCNHLTSFAVLLNISTPIPPEHEFTMEIITYIGCSLSIIACFLTCAGYTLLRLHSDLIMIHGNLAIAVGVAEVVFLCLDLVKPSDMPSAQIPCTVVGALLYYNLLAMFAWMAIEGIHLYLLTFVVWNAERRKIKYYMACGWGAPIVFLIALLAVYNGEIGDNTNNVCFLSLENRHKSNNNNISLLFFIVPVAIVIVFNLFVMIRVVLQIAKMANGPTLQSDVKSRVRHGAKAFLILLPIMGLTWVFGFLAIQRASLVFQYIFVILNSFQGVFIFFAHFIRNSEVRHAWKRKRERWSISQSRYGDYRVKNTKKTSSCGVDKTNSSVAKTPEQTLTLMNMHTENTNGSSFPDKNCN